MMKPSMRSAVVIVPVWLVACAAVVVGFAAKDGFPGPVATAVGDRPTGLTRPTLRVFVHSRCPCSGSTVRTLDPVVREAAGSMTTDVFVYDPDGNVESWYAGPYGRLVASWPAATVQADPAAGHATQSGATTSGTVCLYAADGRLLFSGGVTSGRGHLGPNPALTCFKRAARGEPVPVAAWPVFGCELTTPVTPRVPL